MLRRIPFIACLVVVCTAAHAIDPLAVASYSPTGSTVNDASNAGFLAAVAYSNTQYFNTTGTSTAGPDFSFENGLPPVIPGFGSHFAVRVWFVSQDASYTNALGVTDAGASSLIFSDSHASAFGDYVDLNGGATVHPDMHFFALADIIGGIADQLYVGPKGPNTDHQTHLDMVAKFSDAFANAGSLWYALALDDQLGGGDRDWNDLRVLVQIHPVATPEPATIALLAGFMVIGAWLWRRQQNVLA